MAEDASAEIDIELLIYRMAEQDKDALAEFLGAAGGKIRRYLTKKFGDVLKQEEIAEALNAVAYNVWRFADRYRTERGTPKAWIISIARNEAISILRGENRNRAKQLEYDPSYDPGDHCDEDSPTPGQADHWRVEQLRQIIENELKGLEQAVAKADLAVGGSAEAGRLANIHGTSKGTIYATRSKVRAKIKKMILEREPRQDKLRGKP